MVIENLDKVNMVFDFILIVTSVWMISAVKGFGGMLGSAFNLITWGGIILGLAHLVETITFEVLHWEVDNVEFVHRIIVLAGFVLITVGFQKLSQINKPSK